MPLVVRSGTAGCVATGQDYAFHSKSPLLPEGVLLLSWTSLPSVSTHTLDVDLVLVPEGLSSALDRGNRISVPCM